MTTMTHRPQAAGYKILQQNLEESCQLLACYQEIRTLRYQLLLSAGANGQLSLNFLGTCLVCIEVAGLALKDMSDP